MTSRNQMLTMQEAAEQLAVSKYTIRRWISIGLLKAYHTGRGGRVIRIRQADLDHVFVELPTAGGDAA